MTLNQLEYAIKVAEIGSINQAANQLFVSQSTLSTSIKNLEHELGREIFIRTSKGVELTSFGKTFIAYIVPISSQLSLLDNFLFQRGIETDQSLSVSSTGYIFLHKLLEELRQMHPGEQIHMIQHENSSIAVMDEIAHNMSDIGLFCVYDFHMMAHKAQLQSLHLEFHQLGILDLCVTVGPQNPLYYREESWVTPDMLAPYPITMFGYMDTGPFSDIIKRLGLKANVRFYSDSRAALYEDISFTNAYYLNSDYSKCSIYQRYANMEYLPRRNLLLRDCPIKNYLGWICRSNEPLTPLQEDFVGLLEKYLTPHE